MICRLSRWWLPMMAVALAALGKPVYAQEAPSIRFKFGGGPTAVNIGALAGEGDLGYNMGAEFEVGFKLDAESSFAFGLGYRFFPGAFQNISFLPATIPATPGVPTAYETRVRKVEFQGFQGTALYRRDFGMDGVGIYGHGGIRIGANKLIQTDTGTRLIATGPDTPPPSGFISVTAIADRKENTIWAPGLIIGGGYRFGPLFSLEFNVWTLRVESPIVGMKTGLASELLFGIRF